MPLVMDPATGQPTMAPDGPDSMAPPNDPGMGGPPMGPPPMDPGMGAPPMGPPPGPPPGAEDPTAGATAEDWIQVAIEAAKKAADADETDDIETKDVMKAIVALQTLLATRQKEADAAMGGGPATNFLKRTYGSGG